MSSPQEWRKKMRGISLSDFKTRAIKTVVFVERNMYQSVEQKRKTQTYTHRMYPTELGKASQWRKDSLFNRGHWSHWASVEKNEPQLNSHVLGENSLSMNYGLTYKT